MKPALHGKPPYLVVRTCVNNVAKNTRINRLVAFTWIEREAYKDQVNHKDGDKHNNHVDNLEWVTGSENQRHAFDTGLRAKGSDLYNATLTEDQVHDICRHLIDNWRVIDIAAKFGCSKDVVNKIKTGSTYFHIVSLYDIPHTFREEFSESTVRWVCEQILKGSGDKTIAESSTNRKLTIIESKRIRHKIRYKYISDEYF